MRDIRSEVEQALKEVMDPELNISLWDLGLIYDLNIAHGAVEVVMTLTSIGCPLFGMIEGEIVDRIKQIKGVTSVRVELTFEPPWNMDRMSEEARQLLGF